MGAPPNCAPMRSKPFGESTPVPRQGTCPKPDRQPQPKQSVQHQRPEEKIQEINTPESQSALAVKAQSDRFEKALGSDIDSKKSFKAMGSPKSSGKEIRLTVERKKETRKVSQ